jgi:hypothetical protein
VLDHVLAVAVPKVDAEGNPSRNNGSDADDASDAEIPIQGCQGDDCLHIPAGFLGQSSGRTCAQCRLGDDGELEPERGGDRLVWLHRECRRFWVKERAPTRDIRVLGGGLDFNRAPRQQPAESPGDDRKMASCPTIMRVCTDARFEKPEMVAKVILTRKLPPRATKAGMNTIPSFAPGAPTVPVHPAPGRSPAATGRFMSLGLFSTNCAK